MKTQFPIKLYGKTLSPGLGRGKTFVYQDILKQVDEFYEIETAQIDSEINRFAGALDHISGELDHLARKIQPVQGVSKTGPCGQYNVVRNRLRLHVLMG